MKFLLVLLGTIAFVLVFKGAIKKFPFLFYGLALALDALFILGQFVVLPGVVNSLVFLLVQKCTLALALFVVVMYIGVFRKSSKTRSYLMPIRKELSIMACYLALGHMVIYLSSYAGRLLNNISSVPTNIVTSLIISLILFALLIVLGVTSFDFVKKRMTKQNWKRVQRFSYPFFMLVYVHLLLFLLPPALHGGGTAQISVAIYSVIFIFYAIARPLTALRERDILQAEQPVPS